MDWGGKVPFSVYFLRVFTYLLALAEYPDIAHKSHA